MGETEKVKPYCREILSLNPGDARVIHGQESKRAKDLWVRGLALLTLVTLANSRHLQAHLCGERRQVALSFKFVQLPRDVS